MNLRNKGDRIGFLVLTPFLSLQIPTFFPHISVSLIWVHIGLIYSGRTALWIPALIHVGIEFWMHWGIVSTPIAIQFHFITFNVWLFHTTSMLIAGSLLTVQPSLLTQTAATYENFCLAIEEATAYYPFLKQSSWVILTCHIYNRNSSPGGIIPFILVLLHLWCLGCARLTILRSAGVLLYILY